MALIKTVETSPLPATSAMQDAKGPSNPPTGMVITKLIRVSDTVPDTEPRPPSPVPLSVNVTVPENDVSDWVTCHDICPGPDESDAGPFHPGPRLTVVPAQMPARLAGADAPMDDEGSDGEGCAGDATSLPEQAIADTATNTERAARVRSVLTVRGARIEYPYRTI
jgi:hypothetical protein